MSKPTHNPAARTLNPVQAAREEARAELRALLPVGSTVFANIRHVSRSGMSRVISLHIPRADGSGIRDISWLAHRALGPGWRFDSTRDGIRADGAGMDMGFHLVYSLSRVLYPEGHYCTGSDGTTPTGRRSKAHRCPSNDHTNDWGDLSRQYGNEHPDAALAELEEGLTAEERHERRTAYVSARSEWIEAQRPRLYSKRRLHSDGGYAINKAAI